MMAAAASPSSALARFGLPADAPVEDIEYVLCDVVETMQRIDTKRGALQEQIAAEAASRGSKRRAPRKHRQAPPMAAAPGEDDDRGAVRRQLRDAAGGAKKERKRLEAVCGDLEEALVDAKEFVALRGATA